MADKTESFLKLPSKKMIAFLRREIRRSLRSLPMFMTNANGFIVSGGRMPNNDPRYKRKSYKRKGLMKLKTIDVISGEQAKEMAHG